MLPLLQLHHADSCEKCSWDRTAWNKLRTDMWGMSAHRRVTIVTTHCSSRRSVEDGMLATSGDWDFCWPHWQSAHSSTSMHIGMLFCHNSCMCLRNFSARLHRKLLAGSQSCLAGNALIPTPAQCGPSPYPLPAAHAPPGMRPSTIKMPRSTNTSWGSAPSSPSITECMSATQSHVKL